MRKHLMVLFSILVVASMVLAACGGAAPAPAAPAAEAPAAEATEAAPAEAAPAEAAAPSGDRVQVRWFVGLGTGTDPVQIEVQNKVVEDFNASQDKIELVLEVVPYNAARDTLATQIASGNGPDIVGPVGWAGSNAFYGQWLDLTDMIANAGYDTSQFSEELMQFYQTEEGQVGLPFAVFPGAVFFQKAMFDEAGLNYPPAKYGEKYVMPDGTEVEWSFETLTQLARMLTVDVNGNDATSPDFDKTQIVQYGYVPTFQHPTSLGTFWGAQTVDQDGKAVIPDAWKAAWKWWYDGMWGDQPFIPSGPVAATPEYGAGNPFNAGKVAMGLTQLWYTCCLAEAGDSWDVGVQPSIEGTVHGRIDADTFRILKGTKNPDAAFEVLTYLLGPASLELLSTYGAMPARADDTQAFFDGKAEQYPFVENWDVFVQGLAYPDKPTAESYMPNFNEAFNRIGTFQTLAQDTEGLDIDKEIETMQTELQAIFDKAP